MNVVQEGQKRLKRFVNKDVSNVVLDLIRRVTWAEKEIRKLQKELPHMFRDRTENIIGQLENMAREGEKRVDVLIGKKLNPILDIIENWLKKTTQAAQKKSGRKKKKRQKVAIKRVSKAKARKKKRTGNRKKVRKKVSSRKKSK